MRFSPGCACCTAGCQCCSGDKPNTLYLNFTIWQWYAGSLCSGAVCNSIFGTSVAIALDVQTPGSTPYDCWWKYSSTAACLVAGETVPFCYRFYFTCPQTQGGNYTAELEMLVNCDLGTQWTLAKWRATSATMFPCRISNAQTPPLYRYFMATDPPCTPPGVAYVYYL